MIFFKGVNLVTVVQFITICISKYLLKKLEMDLCKIYQRTRSNAMLSLLFEYLALKK